MQRRVNIGGPVLQCRLIYHEKMNHLIFSEHEANERNLGAERVIAGADGVIGRSRDGGYVLFLLKNAWAELFAGIPWSTPAVLQNTLHIAAGMGLRFQLLQELEDIDDIASWERFLAGASKGSHKL